MSFKDWILKARKLGASDVHMEASTPPVARVRGELMPIGEPLSGAQLAELTKDLLTGDARTACELFLRAREGTLTQRMRMLWASGVYRQTLLGSLALYLAVIMRRI